MTRKMHLAGFQIAAPVTHSHAAWRHPATDAHFLDLAYYQHIARVLERGKFDFLFFADVLATPRRYGNDLRDPIRRGTQGALGLDPTMVVAALVSSTQRLGLAVTKSATYFPPFDIARSFATLDHLSGGRMAWNVVTSLNQAEGQNFGYDQMLDHEQRYDRAEEFLEVAFALWNSWEHGALVQDRAAGIFGDPDRVHAPRPVQSSHEVAHDRTAILRRCSSAAASTASTSAFFGRRILKNNRARADSVIRASKSSDSAWKVSLSSFSMRRRTAVV